MVERKGGKFEGPNNTYLSISWHSAVVPLQEGVDRCTNVGAVAVATLGVVVRVVKPPHHLLREVKQAMSEW
jgi:hypothetical protein